MSGKLRYTARGEGGWRNEGGEPVADGLLVPAALWLIWWNIVRWMNGQPITYETALSIREHLRWFFHPDGEENPLTASPAAADSG